MPNRHEAEPYVGTHRYPGGQSGTKPPAGSVQVDANGVDPGNTSRAELVGAGVIAILALCLVMVSGWFLFKVGESKEIASKTVRSEVATALPTTSGPASSASEAAGEVDVFNAAGKSGLAAKVADSVRDAGWKVVTVDTHTATLKQSVVQYGKADDAELARKVAAALKISTTAQKTGVPRVRVLAGTDIASPGAPTPPGSKSSTKTP